MSIITIKNNNKKLMLHILDENLDKSLDDKKYKEFYKMSAEAISSSKIKVSPKSFIIPNYSYWIIHEKVSNGGTRIECPCCHDTKIVSIYSIYNDTYCSKCGELLRLER